MSESNCTSATSESGISASISSSSIDSSVWSSWMSSAAVFIWLSLVAISAANRCDGDSGAPSGPTAGAAVGVFAPCCDVRFGAFSHMCSSSQSCAFSAAVSPFRSSALKETLRFTRGFSLSIAIVSSSSHILSAASSSPPRTNNPCTCV